MHRLAATCVAVLSAVAFSCGDGAPAATTTTPLATTPSQGDRCGDGDYGPRQTAYAAARAGEVPPDRPLRLGSAVAAVPESLFSGVEYIGCTTEEIAGLGFEQMGWTNGIGLLLLSWQEWPDDDDSGALPFGGSSRQAGIVQVSAMDVMATERTRVVHLFDGFRVITVATFSLTTLSVDQAEEIGWAVYDALPIGTATQGRGGGSRTVDDFLAALQTDQVSVGDARAIDEISPFTSILGIAHTTSQFTVSGSDIIVFDFGALGAARRAKESVSSDGFTIAHEPYEMAAPFPHFWHWDRLLILYLGEDEVLLERMNEVVGRQFAGV